MLAGSPRLVDASGTAIGSIVVGGTEGSVLFVGAASVLAQDNANFFWDDTNNRLGIGTTTPSTALDVVGTVNISVGANIPYVNTTTSGSNKTVLSMTSGGAQYGTIQAESTAGGGSWSLGYQAAAAATVGTPVLTWSGLSTSGVVASLILTPPANTGITASTESNIFRMETATRTWATTGTVATQRCVMLNGCTLASASASQTFTNASTLFASTPIAGANAIITSAYAAWFQANAIASVGETITLWTVSDDATSKLEFINGVSSGAAFAPVIRGTNGTVNVPLTLSGAGTTDTGTNAIVLLQGRIGSNSDVNTRPIMTLLNRSTTRMIYWGSTNDRLCIGDFAATPTVYGSSGRVLEINRSAASGGVSGISWSTTDSQAHTYDFAKSASATVGTHSIVASGENLGYIQFQGSDGTAFISAARITGEVDGTPGTNDMPGRLIFATTADGASSVTEAMRVSSRRNVLIGIGAIAEPSTSVGTLALFNGSTAPTTSVDAVSLYAVDLSAGNATLGLFTETAVAVDIAVASTNSLTIKINNTNYKLLLAV